MSTNSNDFLPKGGIRVFCAGISDVNGIYKRMANERSFYKIYKGKRFQISRIDMPEMGFANGWALFK